MPTLCHCTASFNLFLCLLSPGLHWCGGLSLAAVSGAYSLQCTGLSFQWLLLWCSTGSRAQAWSLWHTGLLALGVWNLPRAGTEPASPALAGGLPTTGPPGKSLTLLMVKGMLLIFMLGQLI